MDSMMSDPGGMILAPDHPFLAKYQAALSDFLRANLDRVDQELKNLKVSAKAKESGYFQDLGVKLYEAKKSFDQRRDKLTDVSAKVANAVEARRLKRDAADALRAEVARAASVVDENRRLSEELADEAARLASDERVLSALRSDVDLQMDVLRNAVQKTEKDLESNEVAKQRQDLFVDRLVQETTKVEREKTALLVKLGDLSGRIGELQQEAEKVAEAVTDAKLGAVAAEKGWRRAVAAASARQDNYSRMMDDLTRVRNEVTVTQTAMQATRRLAVKEIEEHERLAGVKFEIESRNARLDSELAVVARDLSELRAEYSEKVNFSSQMRSTLESESSHGAELVSKRDAAVADVVRLKSRREEVEKAVLANLKASEAGKSHARHLNRLKSELRDASRVLELQAAELENGIAACNLAKAAALAEVSSFQTMLDELTADARRRNENFSRTMKELKAQEGMLVKKHAKVDVLAKKLAGLTGAIELHKDLQEGEALRRAISCLKEETKECQNEGKTLHRTWLKFQHELLDIAAKQAKTEQESDVLADKSSLLEEKSARLAVRIEAERRDLLNARKVIRDLRNAVTQLTQEILTVEEAREVFEREAALGRAEARAREKELLSAIAEKRAEVQGTLEVVAELNREIAEAEAIFVAWDRKYQLCKDFKDVASQEEQENGEMALKRAELNRLAHESELIRQRQEQLTQKLEECVHRRQNLCEQASARAGQPPPKSVTAVARRRVKELIAATAEIRKKGKSTGEQAKSLKAKCAKLGQETVVARMESDSSKSAAKLLEEEIAAKQFEVYVNKEQIASAHDQIRWMEAAKMGKYPFVVKVGAVEKRVEVLAELEVQKRSLLCVLDAVCQKHGQERMAETRAVLAAI